MEITTASELGIVQDLDKDGMEGDETLRLLFDFDPPAGKINYFEGSLLASGVHYAVWPSLRASSECDLLRALETVRGETFDNPFQQVWVYEPTAEEAEQGAQRYIHQPAVSFPTCP